VLRIVLSPVAGSLLIVAAALTLGTNLPSLVVGGVAYALAVLLVERLAFPSDAQMILSVLLRRPSIKASLT
jgi:hypothetical protein